MQNLVQISDLKRPEGNGPHYFTKYPKGSERLTVVEVANLKRPQEILDLTEALTAMFGRIGMHEVCRSCWAGELKGREAGVACCGSCPLVGHKACLAKPMGCALYMCYDQTQSKWPRTHSFLGQIRNALYKIDNGNWNIPVDCYPSAVYSESRAKLDAAEQKLLRVLKHAIEAWEEQPV